MTSIESNSNGITHAGKYLTFLLAQEYYGIPVLKVREIIRFCDITHVPRLPHYINGVINLRGKIIPVMDLCARFDLPTSDNSDRRCIVVIHVTLPTGGETQMGFVVSGVEEVINVAADEIEERPQFGSEVDIDYILGIAKIRGEVKMLLDIDRVLNGVEHQLSSLNQ